VLRGELTGLRALTDADLEGTSRDVAWIDGGFADGVTLSQLAGEWS
jgi:hypothetical protein